MSKRKREVVNSKTEKKKVKLSKSNSLVDIEDLAKYLPERSKVPEIRSSLLSWFDKNKRTLPWRVDYDVWNNTLSNASNKDEIFTQRAYEVWVSEIMLQQTRVQTVIDYYNKWMKNFPTVKSLSETSLEKVNEEWSGLGYYRRAKHLLEGSKEVINKNKGVIPQTSKDLLNLPGIGQYTAGAISSIVFNEVTPLVDGNVIRVLSRLCAIDLNPKASSTVKLIWKISEELVDPLRPGCLNQSLMELGATVCAPTNPSCSTCPIQSHCKAYSKQLLATPSAPFSVTDYPMKVKKAAPRSESVLVCCLAYPSQSDKDGGDQTDHNYKFLITKRPENGLLASLWEFPSIILSPDNNNDDDNEDDSNNESDEPELVKKKKKKNNVRNNNNHQNDKNSERVITSDIKKRKELICEFFKKEFNIDFSLDDKFNKYFQIGETSHLFTHIKQKLIIDLISVHPNNQSDINNNNNTRWLTYSELDEAALSKGMRKCLKLVQQHYSPNNAKKSEGKTKKTKSAPQKLTKAKDHKKEEKIGEKKGKQALLSQFFK